jgi:tetratricopeptide (TPR) repeat protein
MDRAIRPAVGTLALAALCALSIAAVPQLATPEQALLAEYADIAEAYRRGETEAMGRLLGLGPTRLKSLRALMVDALRRPPGLTGAWKPVLFRAAAMIDTELAISARAAGDLQGFKQHTDTADVLLQLAGRREPANDFRSRWQVAVGLELLAAGDLGAAHGFVEGPCRQPGAGAVPRLFCGMVSATYGTWLRFPPLHPQERLEPAPHSLLEDDRRRVVAGRLEFLDDAAEHFRAALSADASLHEASLRLGNVDIQRGRDGDAERRLVPLAGMPGPTDVVYLARLMLGGIRERQGQVEAAAALYRDASQLLPEAPRAHVAQAHLLHASGDPSSARAIIGRLVEPSLRPADDPWSGYPVRFIATPHSSLDDLRREVGR